MSNHDDLISELIAHGVHEGFPEQRQALASRLLSECVQPRDIGLVAAHVAQTARGGSKSAVLAKLLADPLALSARILELHRVEEQAAAKKAKDAEEERHRLDDEERRKKADSSSIRDVTPTNPYGWSNPEMKRGQDHNRPGEWNPYRQSYNRNVGGETRHFGCSRWDVLRHTGSVKGWRPGKKMRIGDPSLHPKVEYDPIEVAVACGMPDPGVPQIEQKAYGEA